MKVKSGPLAVLFMGLALVVADVGAQNAPPPAAAPAAPAGRGQGRGRGRGPATFPAQQREPADPAVAARGKALYEMHCQTCHAADLRGATGPNLLRSQSVLSDHEGELIEPVVHGSLPNMKAIDLSAEDVKTLADLHSRRRADRPQPGRPAARGCAGRDHARGRRGGRQSVFRGQVRDLPLRDRRPPEHRQPDAGRQSAPEFLGLGWDGWRELGTRTRRSWRGRRPAHAEGRQSRCRRAGGSKARSSTSTTSS